MSYFLVFLVVLLFPVFGKAADNLPATLTTPGLVELTQVTLALIAVLAVIMGLAWLMRRLGHFPGIANNSLRILGGVSLGGRERVVLIQVGEQQLLLGVAPGRVQTLHVLTAPLSSQSPNEFAANLKQFLRPEVS